MIQLLLDIVPDARPTLDGFVPGRNAELLAALRGVLAGAERERFLYLWGDSGCGRSHLLRAMVEAFRERGLAAACVEAAPSGELPPGLEPLDCVAVDDADRLGADGQVALFHLCNRLRESGRGVLLASGGAAPSRTGLREDLATRLAWGLVKRQWKNVGLMWLVMIGLKIVWGLAFIILIIPLLIVSTFTAGRYGTGC